MIRATARKASRFLPEAARAGIALRRFGYSGSGSTLRVTSNPGAGVMRYCVNGVSMLVPESARADAQFHFVENGDSRAEMEAFIRVSRAAPANALLLDAGAHKGLFSLVHLGTGPQHRALLLEPSPSLAAEARALIELNDAGNRASVRPCGAGDVDEDRAIVIDAIGFARAAAPGDRKALSVPFVTIDRLCEAGHVWPAIIKIDVEGAEGAVLRGARRTLLRCRPTLLLELHLDLLERSGEDVSGIVSQLKAAGYSLYSMGGRRLAPWQVRHSLKAILRIVATCSR